MGNSISSNWMKFYDENILAFFQSLKDNPFSLFTAILDLAIVIFLLYAFFRMVKGSRAWQLIKGIAFLIIATWVSGLLNLNILNSILTGIMNWGVIALVVIFQPELRRGLEQLGTNKLTKFFGIQSDLATKTKEDVYKVVIAATELSKTKTGALIVFERDINIQDIISTGVPMNSEVSPQLLVNLFVPKTPLHDGAVIISNNKIAAAACVLPLADDADRAAIGVSKESDAIVVVVSEETGKISVAKDGTLIADVREDTLKKILISNIVTKRFTEKTVVKKDRLKSIKQSLRKKEKEENKEN